MALVIKDGLTSQTVRIDSAGRMLGSTISEGPLEEATDTGEAIFFNSGFATGTTNVEVISVENEEAGKDLHITRFILSAIIDCIFTVFEVTSGTPAGTTLIGVNPNFGSTVVNSVTAFGNAPVTGTVAGDTLFQVHVKADTTEQIFVEGSIAMPQNSALAVTANVDTTVNVTLIGFWHTE